MKKYIGLSILAFSFGMTSCNDYLDTLPDDRAEVDTETKVAQFLVSAPSLPPIRRLPLLPSKAILQV